MKKILFLLITLLGYACSDLDEFNTRTEPAANLTTSVPITLNDDQHRSFLQYYAPVIFKQADEDEDHLGYDWITNYFFDNDSYLPNNKENWSTELDYYVDGSRHSDWNIAPTLYTSILEFWDDEAQTKSVILLYHIYHAKQRGSIHDWERVEIRIDGIQGDPGSGEVINYVVITRHSLHNAREYPDEDLNFMETPKGKHVMLWQASWELGILGQAELHFVEDSWAEIKDDNQENEDAKVDINNSGRNRFHYIFVEGSDASAVSYWHATSLDQTAAANLASGKSRGTTVSYATTPRIAYQLQDMADILPTHLEPTNWKDEKQVHLSSPLLQEDGSTAIAPGTHTFYYKALDDQDDDEDRNGYIRKHWFWGVYIYAEDGDNFYESLDPEPWEQHLYFAHNGTRGDGSVADELENRGIFLGKGIYANWLDKGGFDGRWVQLFED